MVYFVALLMFAGLAAGCWFLSVAVYRGTAGGPDPAAAPHYRVTALAAVAAATLTSFVPFPLGYALGLVGYAIAAFGGLGLPDGRAAVLFALLAAGSFATRLHVLGVRAFLAP